MYHTTVLTKLKYIYSFIPMVWTEILPGLKKMDDMKCLFAVLHFCICHEDRLANVYQCDFCIFKMNFHELFNQ